MKAKIFHFWFGDWSVALSLDLGAWAVGIVYDGSTIGGVSLDTWRIFVPTIELDVSRLVIVDE